jgi:hypothetical protein
MLERRRQDDPLGVTLGEVLPRGDVRLEAMVRTEPSGGRRDRTNVRVTVRIVPDGTG